jgi:hypothetical protein
MDRRAGRRAEPGGPGRPLRLTDRAQGPAPVAWVRTVSLGRFAGAPVAGSACRLEPGGAVLVGRVARPPHTGPAAPTAERPWGGWRRGRRTRRPGRRDSAPACIRQRETGSGPVRSGHCRTPSHSRVHRPRQTKSWRAGAGRCVASTICTRSRFYRTFVRLLASLLLRTMTKDVCQLGAVPFEANTIKQLRESGQLSPGTSAAIHRAWLYRSTLLEHP